MKKVDPYLEAILLAIDAVESYKPGTEQELRDDDMRADAILMRLQEIGERMHTAREKFEEDFAAHGNPDWHKVIGLRHIISHDYDSVDLGIIWTIVTEKLPQLKRDIEKWLAK